MAWGKYHDTVRDLGPEANKRIARLYFGSPEIVAWLKRSREGRALGYTGHVLATYCLPQHRALTALMTRLIAQEQPPADPVKRAVANALTEDDDAIPF